MNEIAYLSLDYLAAEAKRGLRMVRKGEEGTIQGWLVYGAALNKGRAMFPKGDNERFSDWINSTNLRLAGTAAKDERAAAMWAAANPEQFEATRKAFPNARTVRGIYAKFNSLKPKAPKPVIKKVKTVPETLNDYREAIADELFTDMDKASAKAIIKELLRDAYGDVETKGLTRRLKQIRGVL